MSLAMSTCRRIFVVWLAAACVDLAASNGNAQSQSLSKLQQNAGKAAQPRDLGQRVFESRCAGCHGLDGRGTERGPDLATRESVQWQTDATLRGTIQHGFPASGMPAFSTLSSAEMQSIVAYLRGLQGASKISGTAGAAHRGQSLFFGKARCSQCHSINGTGGFIASNLSEFGRTHSASEIRRAITDPDETGKRGQLTVVRTRDGREFSGLVRNEDNFTLQLQTLDGGFQFFVKSEIVDAHQTGPLMPTDYGTKLSATELSDLAAFLARVSGPKREKPKADDFEE